MINRLVFTSSQTQYHTRKSNILPKILSFSDEHNFRSIRGGNFEFIIENKKVRKQKNKNSIKKAIKKNRKNFLFFLITFLVEFLLYFVSCFLTFLFSFINSHLTATQGFCLKPKTCRCRRGFSLTRQYTCRLYPRIPGVQG